MGCKPPRTEVGNVRCLDASPNLDVSRSMGLTDVRRDLYLGERTSRFLMILERAIVQRLAVEPLAKHLTRTRCSDVFLWAAYERPSCARSGRWEHFKNRTFKRPRDQRRWSVRAVRLSRKGRLPSPGKNRGLVLRTLTAQLSKPLETRIGCGGETYDR